MPDESPPSAQERLPPENRADEDDSSFDEIVPESEDETPEADFAPLANVGYASEDDYQLDPYQRDSVAAQTAFDEAVTAAAEGREHDAVQHFITASKIAETAREWHLAAVACRRVGDYLLEPPEPCDVERSFRMYRRAVAAYDQSGLFAEARELAYRQMCLKMTHAHEMNIPWRHRIELWIQWATCGFGYRPLRVMAMALLFIFSYAFVYWRIAGVDKMHWNGTMGFWQSFYFSGITFVTVGYGDFIPKPEARILALSEGFIGAFTIAFFVAVLANRLAKA